jgi:hypothetical protein
VASLKVVTGAAGYVDLLVTTPPVAQAITMGAAAGVTNTIRIIGGKPSIAPTDADGDPLLVSSVQNPSALLGATVTTDGTNIFYIPGLNASGADTVQYVVSDGFGGFGTNTLSVTVSGQSYNLVLKPLNGNNEPVVGISGIPGVTYALDHSTNLTAGIGWTNVTQIALPPAGNGQYEFIHTGVDGLDGSHYYRTRYVSGP